MGRPKGIHSTDNHNFYGKIRNFGSIRYRVEDDPMCRTLEEVSSLGDARSRLSILYPGKKIELLGGVRYYEPYKEVYRRLYYKRIFKEGDKNKEHG